MPAKKRPATGPKRYTPEEKAKILERAEARLAKGWSNERTANLGSVNPKTLKAWRKPMRFADLPQEEHDRIREKIRVEQEARQKIERETPTVKVKLVDVCSLSRREIAAIEISKGLYANPRYVPLAARVRSLGKFLMCKREHCVVDLSEAAVKNADLLLEKLDRTNRKR